METPETIETKKRGRGRPIKYATDAERLQALREARQRANEKVKLLKHLGRSVIPDTRKVKDSDIAALKNDFNSDIKEILKQIPRHKFNPVVVQQQLNNAKRLLQQYVNELQNSVSPYPPFHIMTEYPLNDPSQQQDSQAEPLSDVE